MGRTGRDFVESVARIIPGYKGYSERESRRDSDRLLRERIATDLGGARSALDRAISECSRRMAFEHMEDLEAVRRRLATVADRLETAPSGYTGFFDTAQVGLEELERLHQYDGGAQEQALSMVAVAEALEKSIDADHLDAVKSSLDALEAHLRGRDKLMKGAE